MNLELLSESASQDYLEQQLAEILGEKLSPPQFEQCKKAIQILEPSPGKQFWQSEQARAGIYLVIEGKVRLSDGDRNLLVSLSAGASFGELSLFPERSFQPYRARASFQLQLAYLPGNILQTLIQQNNRIAEHLYHRALELDLLLLCRQSPIFKNVSLSELDRIIALLQLFQLEPGQVSKSLFLKPFWLVRTGELVNSAGQKLQAGSLYFPEPENSWQVTQPTELYALDSEHLNLVQFYLPNPKIAVATPKAIARRANYSSLKKTDIADLSRQRLLRRTTMEPALTVGQSQSSPSRQTKKPYFPTPTEKVGHFWQRLIHRYPFYAQQSTSDCGAACLVMIGRYWGKKFSLNRIRELAKVNRSGSSLKGLCTAAETIGFIARPVKATLSQLARQKLPAIAHWQGNHYIVVYEVRRKYIIVGDPALGQRTLTSAEFNTDWTGYTLLLEPTTFFKQTKEQKTSFWQFWELVRPHGLILSEVFIASLLIQLFALVTPLLTQLLLDRVIVQRSSLTLMAVGIGLLIFGLFKVAMTGLRQYFLDHTAQRVDLALIVGFIRHTFHLPLSFFESRYVGDIIARVQENHKIQRFLTGEALSIFLDLLTVFVYVGLMFWYSWQMALLALTIVPPFFLLALIATPFLQKVSREIFTALAKESSYLIEALTGLPTIKSMAVEQKVRWHWEELLNGSIKTTFAGQMISNKLQIFSSTIEVITTTVILWFGAWQVIQNQLTIGQLVAFNMLLGNVINPFQRLTVLWNQLQEVVIAIERINDVLDAEPEEDLQERPRQILNSLEGEICFENVTFRYQSDAEHNVIENLSFKVQPGQTIALVGRSGSGKTTISKMILGLYLPTEGKIYIDGRDLTTLSLRSLREQVGVVDQSNFLFGGTIRENISISHPEANLEEIRQAAIQAGADEFIEKLPLSYETPIGERGGMLSGGQRQRLAIARSLLGNPRLLILDEATSNLDAESERIIQNNLNTIVRGRTTIIIAHRLSTIRQADRILVLDRGVLVESGNHNELMAKQGHYFYLNQQQFANNN